MSAEKIIAHFPELDGIVTDEHVEASQRILKDLSMEKLTTMANSDDHVVTCELGNRAFHLFVDRSAEVDEDDTLVVGGEFANGITPAVVARGLVMREIYNPAAKLVIQPNSGWGLGDNHGFNTVDLWKLSRGDAKPVTDRLAKAIDIFGQGKVVTVAGLSQGGAVASRYSADPNNRTVNLALVESPNTIDRSIFRLLGDFAGSGGKLKENIALNFESDDDQLCKDLLDQINTIGLLKFGASFFRLQNMALTGMMRRNGLEQGIARALDDGRGVVHAWGIRDNVSGDRPDETRDSTSLAPNAAIRAKYSDHPNYVALELQEEYSDHSWTNNYTGMGSLVALAAKHGRNS